MNNIVFKIEKILSVGKGKVVRNGEIMKLPITESFAIETMHVCTGWGSTGIFVVSNVSSKDILGMIKTADADEDQIIEILCKIDENAISLVKEEVNLVSWKLNADIYLIL